MKGGTHKQKAFGKIKIAFRPRIMDGDERPEGWVDWMGDYGITDKGKFFAPARLCSIKSDAEIIAICKRNKQPAVFHPGYVERVLFVPIDFAIKMTGNSGHKFTLRDLKESYKRAEDQRSNETTKDERTEPDQS